MLEPIKNPWFWLTLVLWVALVVVLTLWEVDDVLRIVVTTASFIVAAIVTALHVAGGVIDDAMHTVATRARQDAGVFSLLGFIGICWLFKEVGSISVELTSMRKELTSMHKELSDISVNLSQACYSQVEARHHSEDLNQDITDKLRVGFNLIQAQFNRVEASLSLKVLEDIGRVLEAISIVDDKIDKVIDDLEMH